MFYFTKKNCKRYQKILTFTLVIISVFPSFLIGEIERISQVDTELGLYPSEYTLCAQLSLFYALSEIRQAPSLKDILDKIPFNMKGNTLKEVCHYLYDRAIPYAAVKSRFIRDVFPLIQTGQTSAIFHIKEREHFIMVRRNHNQTLSILDGKKIYTKNAEDILTKKCDDTVLIVGESKFQILKESFRVSDIVIALIGILAGLGAGSYLMRNIKFNLKKG